MKLKAMVVQDRMEKWFQNTADEREVRVLTLLDLEEDPSLEMCPDTFDYRPSKEEEHVLPIGKARLQAVEISVRKFQTNKAGRILFLGRLLTLGGKPFAANGNGSGSPAGKG